MKRVLVTGASGFIGRHSLAPLLRLGYSVHAVARRPIVVADADAVSWHAADLLDTGEREALLDRIRPTHLLHFAWHVAPGVFWTAPENRIWQQATREFVQEFARCGGQRVVMAGTCAEYEWRGERCVEGATPELPATLYGHSKLELLNQLREHCSMVGVELAWGRIFFLYGPHEHPARLVSSAILSLLRGETFHCLSGGQRREYLHVADAAAAFVALLDSTASGVFNIASGEVVSIRGLIETLAGSLDALHRLSFALDQTTAPDVIADHTRLRAATGWMRQYDLRNGLRQSIDWWRQNQRPGSAA